MTIPVVQQFCLAITNGDTDSARSLLPKISIKENIIELLSTLFSHIDSEKQLTQAACKAALEFILNDVELAEDKRGIAQRMLDSFSPNRVINSVEKSIPNAVDAALQAHKSYLPSTATTLQTSRELERRLDMHSHNLREGWLKKTTSKSF